jgi:hypothetical protein
VEHRVAGLHEALSATDPDRDAFEAIDDPYLRSRREDIDHVAARVAAALRRGEKCTASVACACAAVAMWRFLFCWINRRQLRARLGVIRFSLTPIPAAGLLRSKKKAWF